MTPTSTPAPYASSFTVLPLWASPCPSPSFLTTPVIKNAGWSGILPSPLASSFFSCRLIPPISTSSSGFGSSSKTVPLFDLLQRLRRLQTGHLRLPCPNQHRPQGHSRFPPHPPLPDVLKITDREEVKYTTKIAALGRLATIRVRGRPTMG